MKNKVSGWIIGGLLAVTVLGLLYSGNAVANASVGTNMRMQQEKLMRSDTTKAQERQKPCGDAAAKTDTSINAGMMQSGKVNPDMMQSSEMQKRCGEMMKDGDMQKNDARDDKAISDANDDETAAGE